MKNNIVCVTVCRDTTSIGLYEVVTNETEITGVDLKSYKEMSDSFKFTDIINNISLICKYSYVDYLVVDGRGVGCGLADLLEQDVIFKNKVKRVLMTTVTMSDNIVYTRDCILSKKFIISDSTRVDINKFEISYSSSNGRVSLNKSEYDNIFSNMCFAIGTVPSLTFKSEKEISRVKIEKNLTEVLSILIDDLSKMDSLDIKEVERLTRLIDKVNYIRGQY